MGKNIHRKFLHRTNVDNWRVFCLLGSRNSWMLWYHSCSSDSLCEFSILCFLRLAYNSLFCFFFFLYLCFSLIIVSASLYLKLALSNSASLTFYSMSIHPQILLQKICLNYYFLAQMWEIIYWLELSIFLPSLKFVDP